MRPLRQRMRLLVKSCHRSVATGSRRPRRVLDGSLVRISSYEHVSDALYDGDATGGARQVKGSGLRRPHALIAVFWLATPAFCASAQTPAVPTEAIQTSSRGITLDQCYAQAQTFSETLSISEENIRVVQAQYRERLGSI